MSTSGVGRSVLQGRNPGDAAGRPGAGAVLAEEEQPAVGVSWAAMLFPAPWITHLPFVFWGSHNVRVVPMDEIDVRAGEPVLPRKPRNLTPRCREVTRGFPGMPVTG